MNQFSKRILLLLLAVLLLTASLSPSAFAAEMAEFTISAAGSVTIGNTINVTVKISCPEEKIGVWEYTLDYDQEYLEYVSGADAGGGGSLSFVGYSSSFGDEAVSQTVTFRAKKIGSANITVSYATVIGFDSERPLDVELTSKRINIVAAPTLSGNNNLKTLLLSNGSLEPAFSSGVLNYSVNVPFEVREITVSATADHSAARVSALPTQQLAVGANPIKITVTAQNGNVKTYTIIVNRLQSGLAGVEVEVDGARAFVSHDPLALDVPEGFTETTTSYGGRTMLSFVSAQNSITIVHLEGSHLSGWYVYDDMSGKFHPMIVLNGAASGYVILNPPIGTDVPENFSPENLLVGNQEISAYQSDDTALKNIYLVYAMAKDGTCGFYFYDANLSSFLSYFQGGTTVGVITPSENNDFYEQQLQAAKSQYDRLEIISLILAISAVLSLIVAILVFVFRRRRIKKRYQRLLKEMEEEMEEASALSDSAEIPTTDSKKLPKIDLEEDE